MADIRRLKERERRYRQRKGGVLTGFLKRKAAAKAAKAPAPKTPAVKAWVPPKGEKIFKTPSVRQAAKAPAAPTVPKVRGGAPRPRKAAPVATPPKTTPATARQAGATRAARPRVKAPAAPREGISPLAKGAAAAGAAYLAYKLGQRFPATAPKSAAPKTPKVGPGQIPKRLAAGQVPKQITPGPVIRLPEGKPGLSKFRIRVGDPTPRVKPVKPKPRVIHVSPKPAIAKAAAQPTRPARTGAKPRVIQRKGVNQQGQRGSLSRQELVTLRDKLKAENVQLKKAATKPAEAPKQATPTGGTAKPKVIRKPKGVPRKEAMGGIPVQPDKPKVSTKTTPQKRVPKAQRIAATPPTVIKKVTGPRAQVKAVSKTAQGGAPAGPTDAQLKSLENQIHKDATKRTSTGSKAGVKDFRPQTGGEHVGSQAVGRQARATGQRAAARKAQIDRFVDQARAKGRTVDIVDEQGRKMGTQAARSKRAARQRATATSTRIAKAARARRAGLAGIVGGVFLTAQEARAAGAPRKEAAKEAAKSAAGQATALGALGLAARRRGALGMAARGAGRVMLPVAAAFGAYDIGRALIEGTKAGAAVFEARRKRKAMEKRYGTVERAARERRKTRTGYRQGQKQLEKIAGEY